jgi:porphobilinogen synthase
LSNQIEIPIAAYQVSGEYAMLKAASQKGWIDYHTVLYEQLVSFKRAGASLIATYCSKDAVRILE